MKSYSFDVLMSAALTVPDMPDEGTARATLADCIDCAGANFGLWPNGDPILGEASIADDMVKPRLYAVDGDEVDPGSYFRPIGRDRAPLDPRELGTVLAALRFWQANWDGNMSDSAFHDIASDGSSFRPLTEAEIDALSERLNTSPDPLAIPSAADLRKSRLADAGEDMLAALQSFVDRWSKYPKKPSGADLEIYLAEGRAAIAKAKGEEIARQDYETAAKASGWTQSDNRLMWTRPRREGDTSEFAAASDSDRIAAKSARGACEIDSIDPVRG